MRRTHFVSRKKVHGITGVCLPVCIITSDSRLWLNNPRKMTRMRVIFQKGIRSTGRMRPQNYTHVYLHAVRDLVNGCRGFTSKYTLYTFLITTGAEILPNYLTVPVVWLVARQFAVITAAH